MCRIVLTESCTIVEECRDVRIHAYWAGNNFGDNMMNIGVRWKLDLTSTAKKLFGKRD